MDIKNILNSIKEDDYFNRVNLHTHSNLSDGSCDFCDLVNQAQKCGLKYFSICDHNTVDGWKNYPCKEKDFLITGIEFDCFYKGSLLHILGYGIDPNSPEIEALCAKKKRETKYDIIRLFKSRHPKNVIEAIHKAGGIAVFAHPCCCWVINLDNYTKELKNMGLDGIEVYYPYKRHRGILKFHSKKTVKMLAKKYNLIKTGGTDEHKALC